MFRRPRDWDPLRTSPGIDTPRTLAGACSIACGTTRGPACCSWSLPHWAAWHGRPGTCMRCRTLYWCST
jgi:hypothetical protein